MKANTLIMLTMFELLITLMVKSGTMVLLLWSRRRSSMSEAKATRVWARTVGHVAIMTTATPMIANMTTMACGEYWVSAVGRKSALAGVCRSMPFTYSLPAALTLFWLVI